MDQLEDPSIFLGRTVAAERDLDLAEQGRQRGPELVRGIAREPPLPFVGLAHPVEGLVQPFQKVVERPSQLVQLVASAGRRELVARGRPPSSPSRPSPSGSPAQARERRAIARSPRPRPRRRPRATTRVRPSRPRVASTGVGDSPTTRIRTLIMDLISGLVVGVASALPQKFLELEPSSRQPPARGRCRRPSRPPASRGQPRATNRRGSGRVRVSSPSGRRGPPGRRGRPSGRRSPRSPPQAHLAVGRLPFEAPRLDVDRRLQRVQGLLQPFVELA